MTNMTAEVGGFTGYVARREDRRVSDGVSRDDAGRGGAAVSGSLERRGRGYCQVIEIDAGAIRPLIALPGDPGNGRSIAEVAERVRVDIAYAGSCTAERRRTWTCTHGCSRRRPSGGARRAVGAVLHPVRIAGREALLRGAGIPRAVRKVAPRSSSRPAARASCGPRGLEAGDEVTISAITALPGSLGSRPALPRQSLHGRRVGHRGLHHRVAAGMALAEPTG